MANTIFEALGGSRSQQGGRRNLAPNLLQYMQNFKGNPMEQLQSKLNSGEMSADQYRQLHDMAESIVNKMFGSLRQ